MKTRSIITLLLFLSLGLNTSVKAESAKKILDRTSSLLKSSGGMQATFEATAFKGTQEKGITNGTIYVQGNKFKIVAPQMTTWFDGRTQWSHMAGSGEAYVSTPTEAELQSVNPYTFINLYKSGYASTLSETNYNGKSCYNVRLVAKNKKAGIAEMRIIIDKTSYLPHSVRIKQSSGDWLRIRVNGVKTGKSWNEGFFRLNKSDYPDVELIDLR